MKRAAGECSLVGCGGQADEEGLDNWMPFIWISWARAKVRPRATVVVADWPLGASI